MDGQMSREKPSLYEKGRVGSLCYRYILCFACQICDNGIVITNLPTDIETPASVSYITPKAWVASPSAGLVVDSPPLLPGQGPIQSHDKRISIGSSSPESLANDMPEYSKVHLTDDEAGRVKVESLPLSWKGLSQSDLPAIWDLAQSYSQQGKLKMAETLFLQVLEGYRYILGPMQEDVTKAAYAVANLYAENNRKTDADQVIEDVSRLHIETLGYNRCT